jgi:arylsulfatase A-like enzyme
MDRLVDELVETVDSLGLGKNTYIIFTTDNGTSKGISGHMNGRLVEGGKGTLRETGARAPFIVRSPFSDLRGIQIDALSDFSDLFPTILDLAGIATPDTLDLDGTSIASILRTGSQVSSRDWILAMGFGPGRLTNDGLRPVKPFTDRAVRDERYKIWIEDGQPTRLFDLWNDPAEEHNLIDSDDPDVIQARTRLLAVIADFPPDDASPRYDPTPAQPWDMEPE